MFFYITHKKSILKVFKIRIKRKLSFATAVT